MPLRTQPGNLPTLPLTTSRALAAIGQDVNFLNKRLKLNLKSVNQLTIDTMSVRQWAAIWNTLHLQVNMHTFEYDYEMHRKAIWKALKAGHFDLPLNVHTLNILRHIWQDRREEAAFCRKFELWLRIKCRVRHLRDYFFVVWRRFSMRKVRREYLAHNQEIVRGIPKPSKYAEENNGNHNGNGGPEAGA